MRQQQCHSAVPHLRLGPPDMAWLAVVAPLWPWSQRDIWGAVMGLLVEEVVMEVHPIPFKHSFFVRF